MKIFKVLLLSFMITAVLCAAAACGGGGGGSPSGSVVIPDGFSKYENKDQKIAVLYPDEWVVIDASNRAEEIQELVSEAFGSDSEASNIFQELQVDFSQVTAIWYDIPEMSDGNAPSLNLVVNNSEGMKLSDLKKSTVQKEFQEMFDSYYPQMFGNYKPVENVTGKEFGKHYYITVKYDAAVSGITLSACQALTIIGDKMITFTYTTSKGQAAIPMETLGTIFASLETTR